MLLKIFAATVRSRGGVCSDNDGDEVLQVILVAIVAKPTQHSLSTRISTLIEKLPYDNTKPYEINEARSVYVITQTGG
ncbi:Hypothetical predicted protein [Octopus vulgaris]|uniref:Uncharacterized protein n=1 Tax=Octopus vulgaris TaxID=6645 RepID=A0AA36AZU2_OCTVU|nr:Hypothetical predicted protein [Octopus vulgaris]